MTLVARVEGDPAAIVERVRRAVWQVDPQQPVWKERTLESLVNASTQRDRFLTGILAVFSAAALILVLSGLHGTINQAVSRRTREIGLRMALGANRAHVLYAVMRGGFRTTVIGLAAGLMVSVWTGRLVAGLLYRTSPLDAAPYLATAVLLAGVSLAACYLPARRASHIDPSVALR
jgi:putative ABC transport system permease protein